MDEILKIKKKENIMTVLLVFLLVLFFIIILFVITNKDKQMVQEEPANILDINNFVKLEDVDTTKFSVVYKNVNLKKIKFSNITDVLVSDFYIKQDTILTSLENNISSNKEFIENYNFANNITNYAANSRIDSIILYEINDEVLSMLYLVEDYVDYKGVSSNINNIFIDLKNNSILDNETLLKKYNFDKKTISLKILSAILDSHDNKFIDKDTSQELTKDEILLKNDEYVLKLSENFDKYIYLYFYQGNLYLKYNKSDLSSLLFNESVNSVKYSTLKL